MNENRFQSNLIKTQQNKYYFKFKLDDDAKKNKITALNNSIKVNNNLKIYI